MLAAFPALPCGAGAGQWPRDDRAGKEKLNSPGRSHARGSVQASQSATHGQEEFDGNVLGMG